MSAVDPDGGRGRRSATLAAHPEPTAERSEPGWTADRGGRLGSDVTARLCKPVTHKEVDEDA